jgi:hypothetical protein
MFPSSIDNEDTTVRHGHPSQCEPPPASKDLPMYYQERRNSSKCFSVFFLKKRNDVSENEERFAIWVQTKKYSF